MQALADRDQGSAQEQGTLWSGAKHLRSGFLSDCGVGGARGEERE